MYVYTFKINFNVTELYYRSFHGLQVFEIMTEQLIENQFYIFLLSNFMAQFSFKFLFCFFQKDF